MTAEPYSDQDLKFIADHIPDSPLHWPDPDHERRRWLATLEAERAEREALEARLARVESAVRKLRGVLEEIGGGKPPGVTGKEFFVDRANRVLAEVHSYLAEPAPQTEEIE